MSGGGGIKAAMYVAEQAPRDGTILTVVSQGLAVDQALGLNAAFKADLRDFNWIGNMSSANQVTVVWHTSKIKSFDDTLKQEAIIGSTGAGSISTQIPAIYNNVLGAKIKIVVGYPDGPDVNLAMARGEVDGRGTNPWASYVAMTPQLVADKQIVPIMQVGLKKDPNLPNVPLLLDYAKTPEQKQILDFMSRAVAVGRPIATTPGVPAERVAALRKAFDETLRDPAFIAEAERQHAEMMAMTGDELGQLIKGLIETPVGIRDKVREAIKPSNVQTLKGAKAGD
jgi:tripartite-type tricarboxylate transporter receptor subunit TctC